MGRMADSRLHSHFKFKSSFVIPSSAHLLFRLTTHQPCCISPIVCVSSQAYSDIRLRDMTAENGEVSVAVLRPDAPDVTMHWLPCAIDETGEAPVAAYFMPQESATGKHKQYPGYAEVKLRSTCMSARMSNAVLQAPARVAALYRRQLSEGAGCEVNACIIINALSGHHRTVISFCHIQTKEEEEDLSYASWRQLRSMCWAAGAELPLPEGYAGFVLQKNAVDLNGDMSRSWHTTGKFDRLSYWNHDTPANGMDAAPRALEWLSLSIAVRAYPS